MLKTGYLWIVVQYIITLEIHRSLSYNHKCNNAHKCNNCYICGRGCNPSHVIARLLFDIHERSLIIYFNSKTAGPTDEESITSQMSADESYYICGR